MIQVPGGTFRMGSDDHYPEEAPAHRVHVDEFAISETTVTNRRFASFVDATGYGDLCARAGAVPLAAAMLGFVIARAMMLRGKAGPA